MKIVKYIKEHGVKETASILYRFKIKQIERKIADFITKDAPLANTIVIESHNDFDENGGAFYNYLIKHNYNKNYKIVWLLKHRKPETLPENVYAFPLWGPSFKRELIIAKAKYILTDQDCIGSSKNGQISGYLTHGGFGLKNCRDQMNLPKNLTFTLISSDNVDELERYNYNIENTSVRSVILGFPEDDTLYTPSDNEILKVTAKKFSKVFLWMPTFRKGSRGRIDSSKEEKLGIPIFKSLEEFYKLNDFLTKKNALLIIKIHPMQDMSTVKIHTLSNIIILDGDSVKKKNIDNYRLMKDSDALISDYSSAAYDYMHLNRPVGFTMDDVNEYKLGLIVDNPEKFIGGPIINNKNDFLEFLSDTLEGKDTYKEKRNQVFDIVFKYHDGKSCERLANFLKLKK